MKLYGYWRSSCTWRVRIALALKGLDTRYVPINLKEGEQFSESNLRRNPMGRVPTLVFEDGRKLSQSMAIMLHLEAAFPSPPLLPKAQWDRALALQMSESINAGIQPLQNLSVLVELRAQGVDSKAWAKKVITEGLDALEAMLPSKKTSFLTGDRPGIADCCLIPQLYNARRFDCDLQSFQGLLRIEKNCMRLDAFEHTFPHRPDSALLEAS